MYKAISAISFCIRQFLLPNPFEGFAETGNVINLVAGVLLIPISYWIVGHFYERGSDPGAGSLLFLLVYALLTAVLWVWGIFRFVWWWILISFIVCVAVIIGIRIVLEKQEEKRYRR